MRPKVIKQFLNENVIDSREVLDVAYRLLSKHFSSEEIEKKVHKIIKKSKTEKEAINKIKKLKEKEKAGKEANKKENFSESVKRNLGIYESRRKRLEAREANKSKKYLQGTEELIKNGDYEKVADTYLKRAIADNQVNVVISRNLDYPFEFEPLDKNKEAYREVKKLIIRKLWDRQLAYFEKQNSIEKNKRG